MPGAPKPLHRLLSSLVCPHVTRVSLLTPVTCTALSRRPGFLGQICFPLSAPVSSTRLGILQLFMMCREKTVCTLKSIGTMFQTEHEEAFI